MMESTPPPGNKNGKIISMRPILILAPLALLAACATPEQQVRNGLMEAGLGKASASCMADYMTDRLSLIQLKRIGSLASLKDESRSIPMDRLLHKMRALKDPEIITVTVSAGVSCAVR